MPVSDHLLDLIFPFRHTLKTAADSIQNTRDRPSVQSVIKLLDHLAMVLVQDSLLLAEIYPNDPVHRLLLDDVEFR